MFTDTAGYTASTHADEASTLDLLRVQQQLIRPILAAHQGREIKSMGDGFLVEFDSALKATHCAIDIQRRIYERNSEGDVPAIRIRIGVHLGDVVQRGTDILGDAVNIAARIEPTADPGGICISGAVQEQVWNKIIAQLEKLPPTTLKGLQPPIDIYRVLLPWMHVEVLSKNSAKNGLAVLPFSSISPDAKDDYFAEGLTEELITVLSQLGDLRVIARTSVTPYKSTSKGVSQIGSELRVYPILEGSVRKVGNRLRVTAQLIDVASEGHLWAKTYDRDLEDVIAVQTELAKEVSEALRIELRAVGGTSPDSKPPVRPESYLAYLKGRTLLHGSSQDSTVAATREFELAISLDPKNAAAYSGLADAIRMAGWFYPQISRDGWNETARRLATRALELDPTLAEAHASLALNLWHAVERDYPGAEREFQRALSLNPSYSLAHSLYASLLLDEDRTGDALREFLLCEAADPLWLDCLARLASLFIYLGRFDEANERIQKIGELDPDGWTQPAILSNYYLAQSDRENGLAQIHRCVERTSNPRISRLFAAHGYALSGDFEGARAILRAEETAPMFSGGLGMILDVYAELGDVDE